jgi:hypothetical protein
MRVTPSYHQLQRILLESYREKPFARKSDSLWNWLNRASLSGFQVRLTTMKRHDRSPETPRTNRRQFLLTTGSTVAGSVIAASMPSGMSGRLINEFTSLQPYKEESKMKGKPSIVFCHGIWADGSCFSKVIPALQAEGHQCIAAQYSVHSRTALDIRRQAPNRAMKRTGCARR